MIQAKEFRIGNLVHIVDPLAGFVEAEISAGAICDISEMERLGKPMPYIPIELTEEWLLRFGFQKDKKGRLQYFCLFDENLVVKFTLMTIDFSTIKANGCKLDVKYVHQLQNLFYALTGQELEIKEQHESSIPKGISRQYWL